MHRNAANFLHCTCWVRNSDHESAYVAEVCCTETEVLMNCLFCSCMHALTCLAEVQCISPTVTFMLLPSTADVGDGEFHLMCCLGSLVHPRIQTCSSDARFLIRLREPKAALASD